MDFIVTAVYADGRTVEAPVGPRAKVALERRFDLQFGDFFDEHEPGKYRPKRMEMLYYLTFAALGAAGLESLGEFEAWLDLIDSADIRMADEQEADAPRPTQRDRGPVSSSR